MSAHDESESTGEDPEPNSSRRKRLWRPVDGKIWAKKNSPKGVSATILALGTRVLEGLSSPIFLVFVAAPLGGLSIYLTVLLAYTLGGTSLFGPFFLGIWAALIVGIILVLEKTGYARNFEGWDYPIRRVLFVPVAFGIVLGILSLLLYVGHIIR